jgi:DNA polymerase III alpha subunit (gram-positive type)
MYKNGFLRIWMHVDRTRIRNLSSYKHKKINKIKQQENDNNITKKILLKITQLNMMKMSPIVDVASLARYIASSDCQSIAVLTGAGIRYGYVG